MKDREELNEEAMAQVVGGVKKWSCSSVHSRGDTWMAEGRYTMYRTKPTDTWQGVALKFRTSLRMDSITADNLLRINNLYSKNKFPATTGAIGADQDLLIYDNQGVYR